MPSDNPFVVVLMGVSGSGKSTVGRLLAPHFGCPYFDADDFHSAEAIAKMKSGIPLDDLDRVPWLARIAQKIEALVVDDECGVIGCSALKRAYRQILFGGIPRDRFALVYLKGSFDLIRGRIKARQRHFMPPSLLQSQFQQLEEPRADEQPITVDIAQAPDAIVATILREIARRGGPISTTAGAA